MQRRAQPYRPGVRRRAMVGRLVVLLLGEPLLLGCTEVEPADSEILRSLVIHPQFEIELVASEPLVFDPVDLEFDHDGRAFVLEMPGFPLAPEDEESFPGRIVELRDRDGDGRFDERQIFAQGFRYADSILPYRGGLLVADPPNLTFVRDTDGDGRAEVREIRLSGFRVGWSESNFNGLRHGIDNWIYGANGSSGGAVFFPQRPEETTSIAGRDFRFDLEAQRFETVGRMGAGFGLDFDDRNRMFVTHEQRHIQHLVFPDRYLRERLAPGFPPTLTEISDHGQGATAGLYPIGTPKERVNHPEQSGYFSAACGLTYYGGGAFPDPFGASFFVADAVLNLVHRDVIEPMGPSFVARRGRPRVEFLTSSDRSFRPVNLSVGPDGALYLLDMHREIIEHPEWIPDELEASMDLRAGEEKGRIFRITPRREPNQGRIRGRPDLEPFHLATLVETLTHPNRFWRETAQRLLVEFPDPAAVPRLRQLLTRSDKPVTRLHALWTLEGLGAAAEADVLRALDDEDAGVRENALRLAEGRLGSSRELFLGVLDRTRDPESRVRMQAVLCLSTLSVADPGREASIEAALLETAARDLGNEWSRLALLAALARRPLTALLGLAELAESQRQSHAGRDKAWREGWSGTLGSLARQIGVRGKREEVTQVLERLNDRQWLPAVPILEGLAQGLEHRDSDHGPGPAQIRAETRRFLDPLLESPSLPTVVAAWRVAKALELTPERQSRSRVAEAERRVVDPAVPTDDRLHYLALLGLADPPGRDELLFELLAVRHPQRLQIAALDQLIRIGGSGVAPRLLARWSTLGPASRDRVRDFLLYRRGHHDLLLTALEKGELPIGQLNLHLERRRALLRSPDPNTRRRAERLFTDAGVETRKEALARMRPALALLGDPERGRRYFQSLCARCHRIGEEGEHLGPDLTDLYRKSAAHLLHDIVDPNAAVATRYLSYTVVTQGGEILSGLLTEETEGSLTLLQAEATERHLDRATIRELRSNGLSLMPEGLEAGLGRQDMADLLAFLQERR